MQNWVLVTIFIPFVNFWLFYRQVIKFDFPYNLCSLINLMCKLTFGDIRFFGWPFTGIKSIEMIFVMKTIYGYKYNWMY